MAGVNDGNYALILTGRSKIGTIIPDVTIEETHEDRLQITEHPVERGANISDHAYVRPRTVDMKIGWADYKHRAVGMSTVLYTDLLRLQSTREPISVTTQKRLYENMLIEVVTLQNDQRTRYSAIATVRLREVRIASARTQNIQPNRDQSQSTQPPANAGGSTPNPVASEVQGPPAPTSGPGSTQDVTLPPARPADLGSNVLPSTLPLL